jgi:hypothetical protein
MPQILVGQWLARQMNGFSMIVIHQSINEQLPQHSLHLKNLKNKTRRGQVPHSQSSLTLLAKVLEIFSYEINTILLNTIVVFTFFMSSLRSSGKQELKY